MAGFSRVALIGFGEVGQTLAGDLAKAGVAEVTAFDILFAKPDSIPSKALKSHSVRAWASAVEAVRDAELIFSGVTAAADLDAARSVLKGLKRGTFYLDLNSASPGMKQQAAQIVDGVAGRYVEAAVMTPINPHGLRSSMLLGGPHAAEFLERAASWNMNAKVFSDVVGKASATKMCRSVIIKGMEALLTESMLSARHYGVERTVLESLSDLLPLPDWDKTARYMISRALEHGVRRAEEMRESARTVAEAGIEPLMATATAKRQDWSALHKDALPKMGDLGAMIDAIRKDIDKDADKAGRSTPDAA